MSTPTKPVGLLVVVDGHDGMPRTLAAAATRGARLIAVVERGHTVNRALRNGRVARIVDDLDQGLALAGVDAVIIASETIEDRLTHTRRALAAGKHVLCEAPPTLDPAVARSLAIEADERRLRLAIGSSQRWEPPIRDALRLLHSWSIGRVEGVRIDWTQASPATPPQGRILSGALHAMGYPACDLIRVFLGEIVAGHGHLRNHLMLPSGIDSEAFALFRNHDRGIAELRVGWTAHETACAIDVRGSDGQLRLECDPWRLTGTTQGHQRIDRRYVLERAHEAIFRKRYGCARSLVREIEAFVSPVQAHPRPGATGWDGCRAIEMVHAIHQSAQSGMEVELEPLLVHLPSASQGRRTVVTG